LLDYSRQVPRLGQIKCNGADFRERGRLAGRGGGGGRPDQAGSELTGAEFAALVSTLPEAQQQKIEAVVDRC